MDNLIEKLEAATEGSRELDAAIAMAKHPFLATYQDDLERGAGHWLSERDGPVYALDYTTSLDAALTLVPEGCRWDVQRDRTAAFASVDGETTGRVATPALALCIAGLKARAAMSVIERSDGGDYDA